MARKTKTNQLLRDFYERSVNQRLGFAPTSNAIKPVHIANGLARAASSHYGDAMPLHEIVRLKPVQGKKPKAVLSQDEVRSLTPAFADCDQDTLGEIRRSLNEIVTADHAVLGLPNFSSYTLSHSLLATSDVRDQGIGDFIWALLSVDIATRAAALDSLKAILEGDLNGPLDDLTAILLPLLGPHRTPRRDRFENKSRAFGALDTGRPPSHVLGWLRRGLDQLAERQTRAPRLLLLRQLVLLASAGLHIYLVQWEAEINPELKVPDDFCPILLDVSGDTHSRVADASRDSFVTATVYADQLAQWLIREQLIEDWAGRQLTDGRTARSVATHFDDEYGHVTAYYESLRNEGSTPDEALVQTLFDLGVDEYPTPPSEFARYLALRSGFVGPRHGRGRKGYQVSLELLTIFTLAIVPPGEIWTMPQFLDELWTRFGIVVGGRDEDLELLAGESIDRLTQDDLDTNADRLVTLLEEQGLAKRYGDGVRQIGHF